MPDCCSLEHMAAMFDRLNLTDDPMWFCGCRIRHASFDAMRVHHASLRCTQGFLTPPDNNGTAYCSVCKLGYTFTVARRAMNAV